MSSGHADSEVQQIELENLLQLSDPKNNQSIVENDYATLSADELAAQTKTQDFIAFNQAYVSELVKYWH